jgi:dCTP deaminase
MVLSDVDLKAALDAGEIVISPAPDLSTQLGACSLDLRWATSSAFLSARAPPSSTHAARSIGTLSRAWKQ